MIKPFLTYEQQIKKLTNDKKLIISDSSLALESLKTIGYFPVIGGYKTPFINPMTRVYEQGASFEDVLALYLFDCSLREIFFRYLCEIEVFIGQFISYYFCKRHGELQNKYLASSNFDAALKRNKLL